MRDLGEWDPANEAFDGARNLPQARKIKSNNLEISWLSQA